ncbi:MAG: substrate-binding domain-containing protein [Clostridiales bacterium]
MKKILIYTLTIVLGLTLLSGCLPGSSTNDSTTTESESHDLEGSKGEEYYMVTFVSEIEYWKGCYKGFEEAATRYNVTPIYDGEPDYDTDKCIKKLDEIIAKKPAGIALTCMDSEAYTESINKAMEQGIEVVCFDADSEGSNRYSFLSTDNVAAGNTAANTIADLIQNEGDVIVVTLEDQSNHQDRTKGFKETIENKYPNVNVVDVISGGSEQIKAAKATAEAIEKYPNVKAIFATDATSGTGVAAAVKEINKIGDIKILSFDTDKSTLDLIKEGTIDASLAQGTWNMGFWSLQFLFQVNHNLINPTSDWKIDGINPLPEFVDTGVSIVKKSNVDAFYID